MLLSCVFSPRLCIDNSIFNVIAILIRNLSQKIKIIKKDVQLLIGHLGKKS